MTQCTAHQPACKKCVNGFSQNDFCAGTGIASMRDPGSEHYKLRKEVFPQCLWDDGVTQGELLT